ncbi:EthD family reductase [Spirosoma linguale]|uniref:Ethyl tert-butyl ether degradation EthD n=1 Tax=Spirosoma linguale (strain ATCC 33905 / DSM 74 / LMG 10896 / Claus 1) TaxID=504472 RepID=D2QFI1_SPILD|nr:Ethyl tert-butyl ether degradation EthD [Spirosoma linguale DSM 74]
MFSFTVLYPNTEGSQFDLAYYLDTHIPLVKKLLTPMGMVSVNMQEGLPGDTQPAFVMIIGMVFNTIDELNLAIATHIDEMVADVPKFTTIRPITQVSRVL